MNEIILVLYLILIYDDVAMILINKSNQLSSRIDNPNFTVLIAVITASLISYLLSKTGSIILPKQVWLNILLSVDLFFFIMDKLRDFTP